MVFECRYFAMDVRDKGVKGGRLVIDDFNAILRIIGIVLSLNAKDIRYMSGVLLIQLI